MQVPWNYLPMQFAHHDKIVAKWKELIASTEFTIGPFVEAFEEKFARYISAKYVIGTNTGTDAEILALKALGIGAGDEVITVSATFYATVGAIVAVGAKPVFIDVTDRYQMDPDKIEAAITPRTKAIIPVHWGGAAPELPKIMEIAKKHNLLVVEDACMGPGGDVQGRHPGTFGRIGFYSMHPLKPLHVMGDGGMVSTDDEALYTWMKKYRNHGMVDRNHNEFWGVNMRLQPVQAIVACEVLETVKETVAARNRNAKILDAGLSKLSPHVVVPPRPAGYRETYSLYMVLAENRDQLVAHLVKNGVEAKVHYPVPLHLQQAAKDLGYKPGSLPKTEDQAGRILSLPAHQFLSDEQLNYTVEVIAKFYQ